jgi:hypothetical protein
VPKAPGKAVTYVSKDSNLAVLFNNFNSDPNNVYECCVGYTISGPSSAVAATYADAMPFTPGMNATVTKIAVAVGYVTGTNAVTVSLNADSGGLPGAVLKKFNLSGLPAFGSCCVVETHGTGGVPVTAGTQYWVVVKTTKKTKDTWDAWNLNNTDTSSQTFAFYNNGSWGLTSGTLAAFKVMGN